MMEKQISPKESLICNICQKKFERKRDLKQHYFHHDVLSCDVCEKVFDHPKNLKRHYRVHDSKKPHRKSKLLIHEEKRFACDVCGKSFFRKDHLERHYRVHDSKKPYQKSKLLIHEEKRFACDVCGKSFFRKDQLERHYRVHDSKKPYQKSKLLIHEEKRFACDVCGKSFFRKDHLERHCRIHTEKKSYTCKKTGKSEFAGNAYKTQSYTKDHLKKHTSTVKEIHDRNKESFSCSVCFKIFSRLDQLKKHLSSHETSRPFMCNICPKKFTYKQGLAKHYQTHRLKCNMCTKEFYSKMELNQHSLIHRGKTLTKVSSQKKLSDVKSLKIRNQICEENGAYECKECKKKYNYKKNFQRHLLIHEEKRFACDVCDRSYFRKDHLQRHYRIHTGKKSYKCKRCSKAFFNLTKLREHRLSHTKGCVSKKSKKGLDSQRDFKNDYSSIENSSFPYVVLEKLKIYDTEKSYLIPEEKPHVCYVCNKRFPKRWEMNRHLNKHKCIHLLKKVSVSKKCEENLDSQSDFKNYNSSIESDTSLGKLSKSKYPDIKTEKKSYACEKSKKKYNYKHMLQKYFRMHTVDKSFTCDICDKRFHRQDIFENHCLGHSGVKPYECKECGKRFIYKSNLGQHMIIHKQNKRKSSFTCEVCMKKFCSAYNVKRHAKIHNRNKSHICNICQTVFANAKGLKYHCDIYKGKQAYGCSECEKIFHHRISLNRHLLVHKKRSFQCDKCLKKFLNQKSLQAHKDILCGNKSSANICDTFSDESNQNKTTNPCIADLEGLRVINNKDNNICNICQKSFANSKLFKYHLDTCKGRQTYECTKCMKKFHRRPSLTKHLLIHNTESLKQHIDVYRGEKSNNNGDTFSDESSLNNQFSISDLEHQSEIHNEDNNICNICKESFANSRLFKYHLDTYKGRQTYGCPECLKKFHHRVSLNKHLLIHKTGSVQCDVCHKTFADPVTLQQHIHVLSGDTSYECNIEDMFSGESIKNLINKRLSLNKEFNPYTTEEPCVIYIRKEIQE